MSLLKNYRSHSKEISPSKNQSISIEEVIDLEFLQMFQDSFASSTGVGALFFNSAMEPITKPSNFASICKNFFRICPLSCQACLKSDQTLMETIIATKKPFISHCQNGLIDFGAPIILNETIIGILIAGQVLTTPPDILQFTQYAKLIGADESSFLKALSQVSILSEAKVQSILQLLTLSAEKFSELGYQHLMLENKNKELEEEIVHRKKAEETLKQLASDLEYLVDQRTAELKTTNLYLEESLENLKKSQNYLIQTQKMAALGSLVIGLSHELNTPLGIAITSQTYLTKVIESLKRDYENNQLTHSKFSEFFDKLTESSHILHANLMRSAHLVDNLKQIAIDQTEYPYRLFLLKSYILKILAPLRADLEAAQVNVLIDCSEDLEIEGYPGILSQILTNLIQNSLTHGFIAESHHEIHIHCQLTEDTIALIYEDNGVGMNEEQVNKAFDPFYTTTFGSGNNGLGLFTVYNIVTVKLGGAIRLTSHPHQGVLFNITIPRLHELKEI